MNCNSPALKMERLKIKAHGKSEQAAQLKCLIECGFEIVYRIVNEGITFNVLL